MPVAPAQLALPLIAASVVLPWIPGGRYVLYPLRILTTWAHECWHALAALMVGGSGISIAISPDTSGLTRYSIPKSRLREAWVASAGYLGSCLTGCALYRLGLIYPSQTLSWALIGGLALSLVFWVRNTFGIACVLILSAGIFALFEYFPNHGAMTLRFIAIQLTIQALTDLKVLIGLERNQASDAKTLQKTLWLPAPVWVLLWIAMSVGCTIWAISPEVLSTSPRLIREHLFKHLELQWPTR